MPYSPLYTLEKCSGLDGLPETVVTQLHLVLDSINRMVWTLEWTRWIVSELDAASLVV